MKVPRRMALRWASIWLVFVSPVAWPADLTIPNTFVSGTPATAATVNENFSATATAVNSKQDLVTGTCPPGQAIRTVNQNGTVVCQSLSFFGGDGSAGDLTVSASQNWNSAPPPNPNFANITINPGQTLTVPAGTTIRCSGSFTNNGTIAVLGGAQNNAINFSTGTSASSGAYSAAHPGDTRRAALAGQMDNDTIAVPKGTIWGGPGGLGIPQAFAITSFGRLRLGGGAGAGPFANIEGGGLVKIYCEGPIVNAGAINALGASAAGFGAHGGGAGGIVILASRTSVSNAAGTIDVSGGNGGNSNSSWGGAGGGGGGGIIVMVSPAAPVPGTQVVSAGNPGTSGTTLTSQTRTAGSGGGGSGGAGGAGGNLSGATASAATGGSPGYVVTLTLDPTAIAR